MRVVLHRQISPRFGIAAAIVVAAAVLVGALFITRLDETVDLARQNSFAGSAILLAAGDIASCGTYLDEDNATAKLLDANPGKVATLGDNVYPHGTPDEFKNCYDPTWGRAKARTYPAAGNHDYETAGASGYFGYFGAAASSESAGWYSYDLGAWHVIVLNSNCSEVEGCDAGSLQETWLRADLAAHPAACTLAYWHAPRFSSGPHGSDSTFQPFWQALYDAGADIVLNGHDHDYERFAPQTPDGEASRHGIREFVVGTGGYDHVRMQSTPAANSQVREGYTSGVLRLVLRPRSYDWTFMPIAGATFTDRGSARCSVAPGQR